MLVVVMAVAHLTVRVDGVNLCVGDDFGAVTGCDNGQRRADRPHAADRDVPFPDSAADQVIEETDVLLQRRVVESGEGADQRVGRDHAAHQIVAEGIGDCPTDRPLDHGPPRRRGLGRAFGDGCAGLLAGEQRFQQGRPQSLGHQAAALVERGERPLVIEGADGTERVLRAHQQPGAARGGRVGGVRRVRSRSQPDRRTEVVENARRQQAH